jgi:hypothetical protein
MTTAAEVAAWMESHRDFAHTGEIARQTGASHATVRKAIGLLGTQGRIETVNHPGAIGSDQRRTGTTAYRIVTWRSGGDVIPYEPVLEDPALPHQVVQLRIAGGTAVTCNCLRGKGPVPGSRGAPRQLIAVRTGNNVFTISEVLAAWRGWHEEQGIEL